MLNDDVIVTPGWLTPLTDALAEHGVGAVQPVLLRPDCGDRPVIASAGVTIGPDGAGVDLGSGSPYDPDVPTGDLAIFTGGAVVFDAEFVTATGGFDERWFLYYEDVDLALRGQRLGWRYRLVPASAVVHHGGVSTGRDVARTRYLQERNRVWAAIGSRPRRRSHVPSGSRSGGSATNRARCTPRRSPPQCGARHDGCLGGSQAAPAPGQFPRPVPTGSLRHVLAGTIVASNYLDMARILADTFLQHHPDSRFAILVADDRPAPDAGDRVDIVRLHDLAVTADELDVMRTIYDVREFCTAVKPALLRWLLERDEVACYLDPDIVVYAPFGEVVARAEDAGIVLTPHVLQPVPRDGRDISERSLSLTGIYNLGFLAVGRSAVPFLEWWHERLVVDAVIDLENGLFTDQKWVDWVGALFPHEVCRDRGMNVAWWNLHERPLRLVEGRPYVGDDVVRFIHFSGYDPTTPDQFCKWQPRPRTSFDPGSPIRILADAYGDRLVGAGHLHHRLEPYQWDVSESGIALWPEVRTMWRAQLVAHLGMARHDDRPASPPPAFGPRHAAFRDWLEAVGGGTELHPHARIERAVWERRRDLQLAFPDVDGAHAQAFRDWLDFEPDAQRELDGFAPVCADHDRPRPHRPLRSFARPATRRPTDLGRAAVRRLRALGLAPSGRRPDVDAPPAPSEGGHTDVRPFAFVHVPKCAGSSMKLALRSVTPEHRWAPWTFDPTQFGPLVEATLTDDLATQTVPDPAALQGFDAAMGHFSLPTVLAAFDASDVVTVLREPRARLLSHYEYWRHLSEAERERNGPWADMTRTAQREAFHEWLADDAVAYQSDNLFIRQLAPAHPGIPTSGFIVDDEVDGLVATGIELLRSLGWVDVVERGDAVWDGLAMRVGAQLRPERVNVTERAAIRTDDGWFDEDAVTDVLAARTRIDARLWDWVAAERGVTSPGEVADTVWSERLAAAIGADA